MIVNIWDNFFYLPSLNILMVKIEIEMENVNLKLTLKPTKGSNHRYYFHIPKKLTDLNMIDPSKKYILYITPEE